MRIHSDHRRVAYCALWPHAGTTGDFNVFVIRKGQRTCWHRHQKQTDHFFVAKGSLLLATVDGIGGSPTFDVLSDRLAHVGIVPPRTWHGYEALEDETILCMYLDRPFDENDEERLSEREMGVEWPT